MQNYFSLFEHRTLTRMYFRTLRMA